MGFDREWSWPTLFLYVCLATTTAFLFKQAVKSRNRNKIIKLFKIEINSKYIYYAGIYLIFIIFSCFKYIGENIVGTDTLNYVSFFEKLNYIPFDIKKIIIFDDYEYLFYNSMHIVKVIGGNYRDFLFFVNSLMILSLIYFVDKNVDDEKKCVWLVLAYLPLLKSLNIVRNCVAAFIGFISVSFLNKNNIWSSLVFAVIAFLNHYIAVVLFALILFYKFYPSKIIDHPKKMLAINVVSIFVILGVIPLIQIVLENTGYAAYVREYEVSLWGYIPYVVAYLFMICNKEYVEYMKKCGHLGYYKVMSFLVLTLPIFISVNAAYRVLLFFELPVILIFADIGEFCKKYMPSAYVGLYKIAVTFLVFGYYILRICKMWYSSGIMPYYNILFM